MKLQVVDSEGNPLRPIDAADEVFNIEPHRWVLHQAYVAQMANQRAGGGHTLRRGEVRGSTRKIRRQKGTGRSRQGSIRAPHHVGGGIAHGPKPRDFSQRLPKQMKRLAIRSALSAHARAGEITVVEGLVPSEPKTKLLARTLAALGVERRTLLVTGEHEPVLHTAARNIPHVKAMPAAYLNVVDLLHAHRVLMTEDAVRKVEALWGGENLRPRRGRTKAEVA